MKKEETYCRLLPMAGAYNMRDLGGYRTVYGKCVKWKMLFRSDDMNKLTAMDLDYLSLLPLRTVIDFRSEVEKNAAIDRLPQTVSKHIPLSIEAGDMSGITHFDRNNLSAVMEEVYAYIIRNMQDVYKEFFSILSEKENAPLLFHCSAGKDQTGIAAALLLSALGVDRETVTEDYMLSAEHITKKYEFITREHPELKPLTTVRKEYLETAFRVIDEEFGGIERYLIDNLEVDLDKLRELYTE
ncbi:tyrosine-protein phosphatase [Bacteroides salyersiae]|uniref:tyrosine-protein phosphatase n=1 Tax=Bacteroides salyersiae TaxID=291644 RepID=UPI00101B9331|nr:tyrosine-protein phosphatase [Bacteroides salyersiae]